MSVLPNFYNLFRVIDYRINSIQSFGIMKNENSLISLEGKKQTWVNDLDIQRFCDQHSCSQWCSWEECQTSSGKMIQH